MNLSCSDSDYTLLFCTVGLMVSDQRKSILSKLQSGTPAVLRITLAAAYIGVSRSQLYKLINLRELEKIKLGARAAGVRVSALDAWIDIQAAR